MNRKRVRTVFSAAAAFVAAVAPARADLLVSPIRIVLTAENPEARVRVSNQSDQERRVHIRLIDLTATEDGGYRTPTLEERDATSAARILAVGPGDIVLAPNAAAETTIRIADPDIAFAEDGPFELRSHLLFETGAASAAVRRAGGRLADLSLDMASGVSIPVLVRGDSDTPTVAIADARFRRRPDGALVLSTLIEGSGPLSPYGAIEVFWRGRSDVAPHRIGRVANITVYREAPSRTVETSLAEDDYADGVLTVRYVGAEEFTGVLFAERAFDVAPR